MRIDERLTAGDLRPATERFFELAGPKILKLQADWDPAKGSPVFTREGRYTARGWTEWTQGFQYGCQILQFDATGDERFHALGRGNTFSHMAPHVSHVGVHDHGFNNVSTYGNLRRLALEGRTKRLCGRRSFLRPRPQGVGGGASGPMVADCRRYGVHPLVQRSPFAVQRYDSFMPRVDGGPSAWARLDGRRRPEDLAPTPHRRARHQHVEVQRLLWRRARRVRRARARGPRGRVQYDRRQLPLPQHAAGLFAVLDMDPRARVDRAGLCRRTRVLCGNERRRIPRSSEARRRWWACF